MLTKKKQVLRLSSMASRIEDYQYNGPCQCCNARKAVVDCPTGRLGMGGAWAYLCGKCATLGAPGPKEIEV